MMFRVEAPGQSACNVGFYRYKSVSLGGDEAKVNELNNNLTAHLSSSPNPDVGKNETLVCNSAPRLVGFW